MGIVIVVWLTIYWNSIIINKNLKRRKIPNVHIIMYRIHHGNGFDQTWNRMAQIKNYNSLVPKMSKRFKTDYGAGRGIFPTNN